ncbi:hypothetical protein NPIL_290121 [Nephila pilipes]|uniref:Uncharacterized protein n=1 Tax=Nephila pilipes TaxID=299642 RepID=A0A8X6USF3_NEPPI|nr:hypothetical protein NPIL_290121 [Nephila pilipes]
MSKVHFWSPDEKADEFAEVTTVGKSTIKDGCFLLLFNTRAAQCQSWSDIASSPIFHYLLSLSPSPVVGVVEEHDQAQFIWFRMLR